MDGLAIQLFHGMVASANGRGVCLWSDLNLEHLDPLAKQEKQVGSVAAEAVPCREGEGAGPPAYAWIEWGVAA
jgi:hypothetical protein